MATVAILVIILTGNITIASAQSHLTEITPSGAIDNEQIEILFGSSDEKSTPFFEPQFQLIQTGGSITWSNSDSRPHQLKIFREDNTNPAYETRLLKQGESQSFTFQEAGKYRVQSITYPWMKQEFIVADKLNTMTYADIRQDTGLNVEFSWYPNFPHIGEKTYFKINFLDKKTGERHKHIDYQFSINESSSDQEVVNTGVIHTITGQDIVAYSFQKQGNFNTIISIRGINFLPIRPDDANFAIVVTPEFPSLVLSTMMLIIVSATILVRKLGKLAGN